MGAQKKENNRCYSNIYQSNQYVIVQQVNLIERIYRADAYGRNPFYFFKFSVKCKRGHTFVSIINSNDSYHITSGVLAFLIHFHSSGNKFIIEQKN